MNNEMLPRKDVLTVVDRTEAEQLKDVMQECLIIMKKGTRPRGYMGLKVWGKKIQKTLEEAIT